MANNRRFLCAAAGLSVVGAMLLGGCASQPHVAPAPVDSGGVDRALADSVGSVQSLLTELVVLERSRSDGKPFKTAAERLPADDPLQKKGTLVWMGDARAVAQRIATMAGLDFSVSGKTPVALVVSIDMQDRPLASMLESLGTQLSGAAKLVYDPRGHSLELRYSDQ